MQRCAFRLLSLKGPWRSFAAQQPSLTCHSVFWQLVVCPPPPHPSPFFHSFTIPVPPSLPYISQHVDQGVSFSCVRRPHQCDSSLSACLIRNSQLGLESSRRGDWRSALSNPGTVRSALLTPVNQIIIWLDLTSTHTLICTPRLQLIHVRTHRYVIFFFVFPSSVHFQFSYFILVSWPLINGIDKSKASFRFPIWFLLYHHVFHVS